MKCLCVLLLLLLAVAFGDSRRRLADRCVARYTEILRQLHRGTAAVYVDPQHEPPKLLTELLALLAADQDLEVTTHGALYRVAWSQRFVCESMLKRGINIGMNAALRTNGVPYVALRDEDIAACPDIEARVVASGRYEVTRDPAQLSARLTALGLYAQGDGAERPPSEPGQYAHWPMDEQGQYVHLIVTPTRAYWDLRDNPQ